MAIDLLKQGVPPSMRGAACLERARWPFTLEAGAAVLGMAAAAPFAALMTTAAHRLLLAVVFLDFPLQVDTNVANRMGDEIFGTNAGYNVSLTTVALLLLYLRWAVLVVVAPDVRTTRDGATLSRSLVAYVLIACVSGVGAADGGLVMRELFLLFQMLLLYVYLATWIRSEQDIRFAMTFLLLGVSAEALISIWVWLFEANIVSAPPIPRELPGLAIGGFRDPITGDVRAAGTLASPNNLAAYFSVFMAPALAVLVSRTGTRPFRLLAGAAAGSAGVALLMTQSRGGWLAALVVVGVLWVATARPGRRLALPLLVAAILVPSLVFLQARIVTRLTGDDGGAARGRIPLLKTAGQIVLSHPILGVGPNNYITAMKEYGAIQGHWGAWAYLVHNKLALVWAETGTAGLLAFLTFLVTTIRLGWRTWKAGHPRLSPLALGFACGLIGHLIHMQFELFNGRAMVQLLWGSAAIITAIAATIAEQPVGHDIEVQPV